ncbi:MAG: hypothetical protein II803_00070 [Firmicutes bacterium]|nr:hypothetical protein [Bacillota bacterium]MBQ4370786.1 hypothetical protein [Bacillota bacterium]
MALREYKCPNCGAPLPFNADLQVLKCENCGSEFEIGALEALELADEQGDSEKLDWGGYYPDSSGYDRLENTVVYNCVSCGAVIETDENTVATQCPYCNNNVVMTERVAAGLKPDAILPFRFNNKGLQERIRDFQKDKKLLPKSFFAESMLSKVQGMYVPFWLYNADVEGFMTMDAVRSQSYRSGDYQVTDTDHFLLERSGSMRFSDVPVDASSKMDNDLMDSVEPYDLKDLRPFDMSYLSGFVADRYDISPEDERKRAENRMLNTARGRFRGTSGAYSGVNVRASDLRTRNVTVRYVMLPVYLLNCSFNGKKYRFAINGQTGKIVGELPTSRERMWHYGLTTFLCVAGAIAALGFLSFLF